MMTVPCLWNRGLFEAIALLVSALVVAIGVAFHQRRRAGTANERAALAAAQAVLDRKRVVTEADRREADATATEAHRLATDAAGIQRREAQAEIEASREAIADADDAEKAAALLRALDGDR